MKHLHIAILLLLVSNITSAGSSSTTETEMMKRITKMNQQLKSAANKTDATAYKLVSTRHDSYVQPASNWNYVDSSNHFYSISVEDSTVLYYLYDAPASEWKKSYKDSLSYSYNYISGSTEQRWMEATSTWRNSSRFIGIVNPAGNYDSYYYQSWDTTSNLWVNTNKYLYTFDANHHVLSATSQSWDPIAVSWLNSSRSVYTYDASGNNTQRTYQEWNGMGGNWDNKYNYVYTYDVDNNQTNELDQSWDGMGWVNTSKKTLTYAGHNNVTNLQQVWLPATTSWRNSSKQTNEYLNNFLTKNILQTWDTILNSWTNYVIYAYTNNAHGNMLLEVDSVWQSSSTSYVPSRQVSQTFNADENQTEYILSYWSSSSTSFVPQSRRTYQFDGNKNMIYQLSEDYIAMSSAYIPYEQYFWYYQAFTVSGIEETAEIKSLNAYPNPLAGNKLSVAFTLTTEADVTINLFDINGKQISTATATYPAGSNITQVQMGNLPNGIYNVQLFNLKDHSTASMKLVVQ